VLWVELGSKEWVDPICPLIIFSVDPPMDTAYGHPSLRPVQ